MPAPHPNGKVHYNIVKKITLFLLKPFWDYVRWPVSFVLRCFDMNYWFIQLTPRGATSFTGAQMNKWFTGIKRLGGWDGRPNQAPSLISHISRVQGGNTCVRDVQVTRVHWKCCLLFFSWCWISTDELKSASLHQSRPPLIVRSW